MSKRIAIILGCLIFIFGEMTAKSPDTVTLRIIETTDVHGNFFPYNFITRSPWSGSMARVATLVDSMRKTCGKDNVILLDNGDILQGQPPAYYFNFIDTVTPHLASRIYDFMQYDAAAIGNHDVETGHDVYDRWIRQTSVPVLGANVVSTATGKPYLKPYTVIERHGVKIAVLGLLTPAIPAWLPENLWEGLRFDDMVKSASHWVKEIEKKEKPDAIVGLFHSGRDYTRTTDGMMENASLYIAEHVPGLDMVFFGHDHQPFCEKVKGAEGKPVWVMNPANNANAVAMGTLTFTRHGKKYALTGTEGCLEDVKSLEPSARFMEQFNPDMQAVKKFVDREIGECTETISTKSSYFGPSAFMQLVHELQLAISGADISLAAPLTFDAVLHKGPLHVSDMFTLYKYENMLYTMRLTGKEIKDYLEFAYGLWTSQINPDSDRPQHLLLFAEENPTPASNRLKNPSYNFDSAFGIDYTVDVTRPEGEKITITGFSDGRAFHPDSTYTVAVNSYRGNGGGDLLTKGAGIARDELAGRLVKSTDHDLRYYLLREVERRKRIEPRLTPNWKFVPEKTAEAAAKSDSFLLFGPGASTMQK